VTSEYAALQDKVAAFTRGAWERAREQMACRRGCDSCCSVWLSVSQVEAAELRAGLAALPFAARAEVAERGRRELAREAQPTTQPGAAPRCALLESDGSCAVYAHRPLVCRTQGHALRYPPGFIPVAAVRARTSTGEITHCPLNFSEVPPRAADVLDAERVDQILALVNRRFCEAAGLDPEARHALSQLAADALTAREP
jgi:Fe-S-cluster containining protein